MRVLNALYVDVDGHSICVNCIDRNHKDCLKTTTLADRREFSCECDCMIACTTNKIPDESELRTSLLVDLQKVIDRFEKSAYRIEADSLKAIASKFVRDYY